jgi:hypothetical protein
MAIKLKDSSIAVGLSVVSAVAGLASIPASLWEWDEILFAKALQYYNVLNHAPHPPGFPVFVGLAKLFDLVVHDRRLALSLTSVVFAAALGAGLYYLFREIFRNRAVSIAASLLAILAPAVLVHAAAPRSDGPGFAAGVWALVMAFRARSSPRALLPAGLAIGLGAGVRVTVIPTAALALLAALIIQLRAGRWRLVLACALAAILSLAAAYTPAILLTGASSYFEASRIHAARTSSIDTITASNVNRVVSYRASRFFVDPWGGRDKAEFVFGLAIIGLLGLAIRDRRALGRLALAFLPILVFTFLAATPLAGPLYALPYLPLITGLAADGIIRPARALGRVLRRSHFESFGVAIAVALGLMSAAWIWPVLAMRRTSLSPPAQAMRFVLDREETDKPEVFYDGLFRPQVQYYLPEWTARRWQGLMFPDLNLVDPRAPRSKAILISTVRPITSGAVGFSWPDPAAAGRLRRLSLGRYEHAYVMDLTEGWNIVWLEGWGEEETGNGRTWRWTGERGRVALFCRAESMRLILRAAAHPSAARDGGAHVMLKIDGVEVDRFMNSGEEIERTITVPGTRDLIWRDLTIETDRAYEVTDPLLGPRKLGLMVLTLDWAPAPGAAPLEFEAEAFLKDGWYPAEPGWRWTRDQATVRLPAVPGDGLLGLTCRVPPRTDGKGGLLTLEINGQIVDSFQGDVQPSTRLVRVPASIHGKKPSVLILRNKDAVKDGTRGVMGICVYYLGWAPVGPDWK